jgi:hypothetical protein
MRIRPSFLFNAEAGSGSSFHFNAETDPDAAAHQSDVNLLPLEPPIPWLQFESLQTSNVSVYSPPRLHFAPLMLLSFDLNADPDPDLAFHSTADLGPNPPSKKRCGSIRILISNPEFTHVFYEFQ